MNPSYLMALDAGGSGGHCLLVDVAGGAFTRIFRPWSHSAAPETGGLGTDLDLDLIWATLAEAARAALAKAGATPDQVLGVAATSMRHTTVVLDEDDNALLATPNRDARAAGEAFQLASEHGSALYARTGQWPSPLATVARLRWLATTDPDAWARATMVLTLSDWIAYRLCGESGSEPSQASPTLLFDVAQRAWAPDLADELSIPRRLLPPLRPAGTRLGTVTPTAAELFGLRAGTPVAVAGADTQCAMLGVGAVAPGQVGAIGGTTVPVQLVLDRPVVDPGERLWTGCHVLADRWVLESNAGAMGEALDWFARILHPDAEHPVAHFLAEAGLSEPGAAGILSTLGTGVMNARELRLPTGTVTLSHLSTAHDPQRRRHLERAVVDGMAYAVRANLEQLSDVAATQASAAAFSLAGGMSRSAVFAQLLSDVLGMPVEVGATPESTALGAALCAGVAVGVFADLAEGAQRFRGLARTVLPDGERTHAYGALYGGWQQLRAAGADAETLASQLILPSALKAMSATAARSRPALRPRILVTADMDDDGLAALRALGDAEYASFRTAMRLLTGPSLVKALAGAQVFITEVDVVDADAIRQLPDLKVVAACRGNAVNVDLPACTAFGIPVLHAPGRNADAVADLTVAFLLMLARRLPTASTFLRQPGIAAGDMGRMGQAFTSLQGRELWHKTIGLGGFGAGGRAGTQRLHAFGAGVLVFDPYVDAEQIVLADAEPATLDELLENCEFVSLHAAVSEQSRGMIGAAALARMRPGACLVNTARAALVDEAALVDALRSGHLGGAALDVFSVEPPGSDHPLLALDNVIATPHVGGNTIDVAAHQGRIIAADLRRLLVGEAPLHVLNPETLRSFDWSAPRPTPETGVLEQLARQPGPAVSDLQLDHGAATTSQPEPASPATILAPSIEVPPETRDGMRRILKGFVERITHDEALGAFAAGKSVTLRFTLTDVDLAFFLQLQGGAITADLGDPAAPADVELRMRAEILDGMFTGRVNPMQAAMGGRLSFSGDTTKAMTLQNMQDDLARLYREAREEAGDPGDLAAIPDATAAGPAAAATTTAAPIGSAGDLRDTLLQTVHELYTAELITATGGNVSVRIPGTDQLWITPSQMFKGDLRPEILVRLDLDGHVLDPGAPSPSSERMMHCLVYRARPDAQAVVHAHAPHATMLVNTGLPFLPVSTEAAFFGDIPRVPFIMPGTDELAHAVAEAIRDGWAVLMQNHGILVAGRSLRRAADMVEIIDRSAEIILGCYAVGKEPTTLPGDVVEMLQKMGDLMA
ncbi:NAD(P)-dependent oxidoreductase [Mycobacterium persicum]|uniref:NAD(P)-dependent oxidoreductase n=1 Tax=Mycobacterium persicum TaxID=1487726 RepID=UPI000C076C68|nr:NAD(P)-dependent oxidoreductase [Mycobacterium persicum]